MGSKDSVPSEQHTPRQNALYDEHSSSDQQSADQENSFKDASAEPDTAKIMKEMPITNEPEPEDFELIQMLKSDDGSDLVNMMCKNDSLKNLIVSFMHDSHNPELRQVLMDSIASNQGFTLDSSNTNGPVIGHNSSQTPISDILQTSPQSSAMVTDLLTKMQSDSLVKLLLHELAVKPDGTPANVLSDTIAHMDSNIVIPQLMEFQNMSGEQQQLMQNILLKISQQPDFMSDFDPEQTIHKNHMVATEPKSHHNDQNSEMKQDDKGGDGPDANRTSDDNDDDETKSKPLFSFGAILSGIGNVINAVKGVLSAPFSGRFLRVDWLKNSLDDAITHLQTNSTTDIIDDIRSEFNSIVKQNNAPQIGLDISGQPTPTLSTSLVSIIENMNGPHDLEPLKQFFHHYSDSRCVQHILQELQHTQSEQTREILIQFILEINPRVSMPVILESQFQEAISSFTWQQLLVRIQQTQASDTMLTEVPEGENAIFPQTRDGSAPPSRPAGAAQADPPPLLSFLDYGNNSQLWDFVVFYLSQGENVNSNLSVFMHTLETQIQNGTLSEARQQTAIRLLRDVGQNAIPTLLEHQDSTLLSGIIHQAIDDMG